MHTGRYSLKQLAEEALGTVRPMAEKKRIRLETEISDLIPDALLRDAEKLKEVTVSMLANAISHGEDGTVRLSAFGKVRDDSVHLLISVRTLPEKEDPDDSQTGRRVVPAETDLDLHVADSLLACLGSELKSVRSADAWMDIYFEIDQQVADSAPVGTKAAEEIKR